MQTTTPNKKDCKGGAYDGPFKLEVTDAPIVYVDVPSITVQYKHVSGKTNKTEKKEDK